MLQGASRHGRGSSWRTSRTTTTRQLGSVLGAAIVGAVLQNQLAAALHQRALDASGRLPPQVRQGFVDGFAQAAKNGLQVGRGHSGGAQIPAGLPPQDEEQLARLIHDVFANSYLAAMRPTVLVAVAVLLLASVSCLLIQARRRPAATAAEVPAAA